MDLVEEIAPGTVIRHLATYADQSVYQNRGPQGGYPDQHHDQNVYNDYHYDNYVPQYPSHESEGNDYYYTPSHPHHSSYPHHDEYDNVDREWERRGEGQGGSWKGGSSSDGNGNYRY